MADNLIVQKKSSTFQHAAPIVKFNYFTGAHPNFALNIISHLHTDRRNSSRSF